MTLPAIIFPDVEQITCEYLTTLLEVPCVTRIPTERPESFVIVRRIGGTRQTVVTDAAELILEAFAATDADAHDLAQLARAWTLAMAGTTQGTTAVYRVDEISGPENLPDPVSEQPRYTLAVQVAVRGTQPPS